MIFQLQYLPHPYANDPSCAAEGWGKLAVIYQSHTGAEQLLTAQWNLDRLVEWFVNHSVALTNDIARIVPPHESLAQFLQQQADQLAERQFADESEEAEHYEFLYMLHQAHSLRSAFEGTHLPDLMIGRRGSVGEISIAPNLDQLERIGQFEQAGGFIKKGTWRLEFDWWDFWESTRHAMRHWVGEWQHNAHSGLASSRAAQLDEALSSLSATPITQR